MAYEKRFFKNQHSYAAQLLRDKNTEIYQGTKRILNKPPRYIVKKEIPGFYAGDTFVEFKEDVKYISYPTLRSMKFIITGIPIGESGLKSWYHGQKRIFKIVPDDGRHAAIRQLDKEYAIQYNESEQAFRLVGKAAGPSGAGPVVYVSNPNIRARTKVYAPKDYVEKSNVIIDKYFIKNTGIPERPKFIEIKELPFMITKNNEIVCLDPELDEPRIGLFGTTGMGKSYAGHALIDMAHHHPYWRRRVAIINDSQGENGTWCMPNEKHEDMMLLRKFGLTPKPLPMVYLHPTLEDNYEKVHFDEVGFDISLPYAQIVEKFNDFFKLEGSEKYFQDLKDEILKCRNKEDVVALMTANKNLLQTGTMNKISSTLGNIFKFRITDVTTNVPAFWKVRQAGQERVYTPLTACLFAGLIPCMETQTLINYQFFPQYYKYYVKDVFDRQNNDLEFRSKQFRIWLYVDEVLNVAATDNKSVAEILLTRTVTEGRIRRIGTILATQNFGKLPVRIRSNIKTIMCFNNPQEASRIVSQYNMPPHFVNVIKELKKFEMVAYTVDHFIVYGQDGSRRKERGPFIGRSFPTLSLHQKPLSKEVKEEEQDDSEESISEEEYEEETVSKDEDDFGEDDLPDRKITEYGGV